MKTIRSILVPTDFSSVAAAAYRYALRLADTLGASIDVMYTIPPTTTEPGYGTFINTLETTLRQDALRDIGDFVREGIRAVSQDLKSPPRVDHSVRVGDLRFSIHQHVEQEGIQLIVMGTKGSRSAWDDFLGTHASFLSQRPPCPVLVLPPNADYALPRRICFATDLEDVATLQAGKLLHSLQPLSPDLYFLHVRGQGGKSGAYDLSLLRELFDRPDQGQRAHFAEREGDDVVATVLDYAGRMECDWVVMHRPERPWFQRLLHRSHVGEAVRQAKLPIMVLNNRQLMDTDQTANP
jgi:nucleotide-binding universal stress UspA family protein